MNAMDRNTGPYVSIPRNNTAQLISEPKRSYSTFVKGYERMMVRIPHKN
jgi:hypothetical protein